MDNLAVSIATFFSSRLLYSDIGLEVHNNHIVSFIYCIPDLNNDYCEIFCYSERKVNLS